MSKRTAEVPHLLDVPALAELLATTPRHVRRLVAEHRIPYLKCGHFVRFDPSDVLNWLAASRVPSSDPQARSTGRSG
ncbi:MAG: helix-turn-helix domain-containing protein [Acidimicrobiales bacterium]